MEGEACSNHPESVAKHQCERCSTFMCIHCISGSRPGDMFCRPCSRVIDQERYQAGIPTRIILVVLSIPVSWMSLIVMRATEMRVAKVEILVNLMALLLGVGLCYFFLTDVLKANSAVAWTTVCFFMVFALINMMRDVGRATL